MLALILAGVLLAPTPSPTLSPLPTGVVNYYAIQGANAAGLDASLIRSVIDNESAGDPNAVSAAGAVGLMQLEPDTANDCGVHDRYDALTNAICGSSTLRYLIIDFGLSKAIAAYNWGAGNIAAHPNESEWPQETKTYVTSVLTEYDQLQHEGPLAVESPAPPSPPPTRTPTPCIDKGVQPFMVAAQTADSFVAGNAIKRGALGIRFFGSASPIGFLAETFIFDVIFHRVTRHASCGVRTAGDLLLTGAAINNAASMDFPK